MKRRVGIHISEEHFEHFRNFWRNPSRFQEIGLRLLEGCLHTFEVIDEKLFRYSIIKYEIVYRDFI